MTVSFSLKDIEALNALIDQMETDREGASDPDYLSYSFEILHTAQRLLDRMIAQNRKERDRKELRRIINQLFPGRFVTITEFRKMCKEKGISLPV